MNAIEHKKNNMIEGNDTLDLESKKQSQEKIKKEGKLKISELASKVLLTPIKKGLESLKLLVSPEKSKKEVKEKLLTLDEEKSKEKTDALRGLKKTLTQFKENIKIPYYYSDYAKKGSVEAAQTKSVESLYDKVYHAKEDPNLIARWVGSLAHTLLS